MREVRREGEERRESERGKEREGDGKGAEREGKKERGRRGEERESVRLRGREKRAVAGSAREMLILELLCCRDKKRT